MSAISGDTNLDLPEPYESIAAKIAEVFAGSEKGDSATFDAYLQVRGIDKKDLVRFAGIMATITAKKMVAVASSPDFSPDTVEDSFKEVTSSFIAATLIGHHMGVML